MLIFIKGVSRNSRYCYAPTPTDSHESEPPLEPDDSISQQDGSEEVDEDLEEDDSDNEGLAGAPEVSSQTFDDDEASFYSTKSTNDSIIDDLEDFTKLSQAGKKMARILQKTNDAGWKIEFMHDLARQDLLADMKDLHEMMEKLHSLKAKVVDLHKTTEKMHSLKAKMVDLNRITVRKLDDRIYEFDRTTRILQWVQDVAEADQTFRSCKRKFYDMD